jgi:hypothetical protein
LFRSDCGGDIILINADKQGTYPPGGFYNISYTFKNFLDTLINACVLHLNYPFLVPNKE